MQRTQEKGNRVDWGSLSPLLVRERAERQGRRWDMLARLLPGSEAGMKSSFSIRVQDVQPVPMGCLLTLEIIKELEEPA